MNYFTNYSDLQSHIYSNQPYHSNIFDKLASVKHKLLMDYTPGIKEIYGYEYEEDGCGYLNIRIDFGNYLFLDIYGSETRFDDWNPNELSWIVKDEDEIIDTFIFGNGGFKRAVESAQNYQEEKEGIDKDLADTYNWLRNH